MDTPLDNNDGELVKRRIESFFKHKWPEFMEALNISECSPELEKIKDQMHTAYVTGYLDCLIHLEKRISTMLENSND